MAVVRGEKKDIAKNTVAWALTHIGITSFEDPDIKSLYNIEFHATTLLSVISSNI